MISELALKRQGHTELKEGKINEIIIIKNKIKLKYKIRSPGF